MLVTGAYSLVRLPAAWRAIRRAATPGASRAVSPFWRVAMLGAWLLVMAVLGVALGAIQLIPLLELLPHNFRAGSPP